MGNYTSGRASDFGGINIESRRSDSLNGIRFNSDRDDPSSANDVILYRGTGNTLRFWDGSSVTILGSAGGLVNYSLNDAYDDGTTITVDGGAVTLTGSHASNNTLAVSGSGTGNLIDLTNTGSGNDIDGTSSTWSVSAAGAAVFTAITGCDSLTAAANLALDATGAGTITLGGTSTGAITLTRAVTATYGITITGSADSTRFTITAGDAVMSNGKLSITNDDTDTALTIVADVVTIGKAIDVNADGITSGAVLHLDVADGAGFSGSFIDCYNNSASVFNVKRYGATVIAGNTTGTAALTLTAGDFVQSDGAMFITQSANAAALTIVADAVAGNNVVDINGDGVTNGTLLHLDTTEGSFAGKYIDCYRGTGAATCFSVGLDGATIITSTSAATIPLIIIHGGTTGDAMQITCSALTNGDALQISQTAETFAAGELLKIVNTEDGNISATPKTGNLVSVTSSVTSTTASASLDYDAMLISRSNIANCGGFTLTAAGSALKLMVTSTNTAGTCTDSTKGLEIVMADGGTAAPTGTAADIISVGVGAKALNVTSASTTVSDVLIAGSGVKASTKAVVEITSTGSTAAGGSILRVAHAGTGDPAAATSYLAVFSQSSATCANNPVAVIINAGASTAAGLQVTGSGASAGGLLELNSTATGALGAVLKLDQTANSAAANDVIGRILFTAQDNANAAENYARIDCLIQDTTAANPDASLNFLVDRAGTVTLALTVGWDDTAGVAINGIAVGDGAAAAIVSSNAAYDLVLETNGGTNSGTITITDAANGDISITPNGIGQIQLTAPTYGQYTAGADGAATLTIAMVGLYTCPNTVARTLTLPAAATSAGAWYTIKKTNAAAAAITVDANGAELIDGNATFTEIDALYDCATFVCDGTGWHVVSKIIAA